MKHALLPRMGDMLFISVLAAGLLVGQRMLNMDSDLGRHLTLGRYILDSGAVPTHDVLSYTHDGEVRPPYEWLAQVAFAATERLMGLDGVVIVTAGILAAAFLTVQADALERGGGLLSSLMIAVWAAATSSIHWLTRPHVFSILFLAIWLSSLDRVRRGGHGWIWQLPLLMLLWANLHGGFVFGFLALGAYELGSLIQPRQTGTASGSAARIGLAGAASLVTSFITPGLGANWVAVLRNSNAYIRSTTAEALPVSLAATSTWPFCALVLIGVVLAVRRRHQLVAAHVLLLFMLAGLAFAVTRNIPLFCVAAVPVLAVWANPDGATNAKFRRLQHRVAVVDARGVGHFWAVAGFAIVVALAVERNATTRRDLFSFDQARFPVAAADWAAQNEVPAQIFNDLNWGGYLLYRMWPERRVFIDSQSDFYGEPFIREYADIYHASGDWPGQLDRYGVAAAILPPTAPLAILLGADSHWQIAFQDSTAIVYTRRQP